MRRIITISILLIMVISIIIVPKIYANNNIFSVPENQINVGETLKVYINVENISGYVPSKIVLSTDIYLEPILDVKDTNMTVDDTNFNSKTREFIIENIPDNVKTLCVLYAIPNYISDSTKIKLVTKILDQTEEEKGNQEFEITIKSNKTNNEEELINNKEELTQKDNTISALEEKDINKNTQNAILNTETEKNNVDNLLNNNEQSLTNISSVLGGTKSNATAVTYKGERNNYLSSITISGYELTPIFNKTNSTYFLSVGNDVTSISINAEKDDSSATISISGNTNLKEGQNKILISVTADNGNIRYYRIYVTRKGIN